MATAENFHIHRRLILRDQELFHRKKGLGFYHESIFKKHNQEPYFEGREIWLPEETQEVIEHMNQGKSVLLEGKFAAGKSAILYGIRSTARSDDYHPYFYYDGHYSTTKSKVVLAGLTWAQKNNAWIVWDSLDYLVVSDKRYRKQSYTRQTDRSSQLIDSLIELMDNGEVIAATTHDSGWFNIHGFNSSLGDTWADLKSRMYIHTVKGALSSESQLRRFYGISLPSQYEPAIDTLASAPSDIKFRQHLVDKGVDLTAVEKIIAGLGTYAIAKIICFENHGLNTPLLESLSNPNTPEKEKWLQLALFVSTIQQMLNAHIEK